MIINMLGIDIAKSTFQLHGADYSCKAVHIKRLARRELAAHAANLPACAIMMEACGGANYWARVFQGSGHTVKLISPQFVKPFVKNTKNDANDAPAIVEAASSHTTLWEISHPWSIWPNMNRRKILILGVIKMGRFTIN